MSRAEVLPVNRRGEPFDPCSEVSFCEAEREMAAFVAAARELHGIEAGQLAAEYWIDQLNKSDWSNQKGPIPRQVTIAAASRLAKNTVDDSSNPSRHRVRSHDAHGNNTAPSARGKLDDALFGDALRPIVVGRNPRPKHRASKTQPPGLRLVDKQVLKILDSPTRESGEEMHWPGVDLSEPPEEITGWMIAGISHDMRNYLCTVFANVELMAHSTMSQSEREGLLEDVHSAIRFSIDILDSLLLPSTTGCTHNFRSHSLNQLIAHVVKMVRIHPDARKAELSFPDHPILEVYVDSRELGRAIYNLLLNACQAGGGGSEPRRIQIALREERTSIQIRVIDNGPGVPETIRRTFGKSLSGRDRRQSIGLGLTVAQRAARGHGGFLELEESTAGNTVFVFQLSKAQLRPIDPPIPREML